MKENMSVCSSVPVDGLPEGSVGKVLSVNGETCEIQFPFIKLTLPVSALVDAPKHRCLPEDVIDMTDWLQNHGGIAVWSAASPTDPNKNYSTALKNAKGELLDSNERRKAIIRIVTTPDDMEVVEFDEIQKLSVSTRKGKLTKVAINKINKVVTEQKKIADGDFRVKFQEDIKKNSVIVVIAKVRKISPFGEWKIVPNTEVN